MTFSLDRRFKTRVRGRIERYTFQVGVLEDAPHKEARTGKRGLGGKDVLASYAGGPIRKKSSKDGPLTIAQVSAANRERLGFNYLSEPFKNRTADIIQFSTAFFKLAFGQTNMKRRAENLLQAIVRNPILRGEYGSNSALTKRIKGFDRKMIDTAQLFRAIKAIVSDRGKRV